MPLYTCCTSLMSVCGDNQCFTKRETVLWHCDRKMSILLEQSSSANTRWQSPEVLRRGKFTLEPAFTVGKMQVCIFLWRTLPRVDREDRKITERHNRMAALVLLIRAQISAGRKQTTLGYFRSTSKCLEAKARISWYSDLRRGADKDLADQEGNKLQRPNSTFIRHTTQED